MPKKDEEHRKRVVVEEIKESHEGEVSGETEMPAKTEEVSAEEIKETKEETAETKEPEKETPKEEKRAKGPEPVEGEKPKPEQPKETEEKKSLWYIFWIMIPVAIIVGALAGGVFYFLNSVNKNAPSPTPAVSTSPTPSSSPSATLDLSKYQIKVLNGSGIAGEAGKVQGLLASAGFKVSETGNAGSYDFTDTVLQIRTNIDQTFVTKLSETLSKTYSVDPKTQSLPAGETSDVVVIVGSSKAAQ